MWPDSFKTALKVQKPARCLTDGYTIYASVNGTLRINSTIHLGYESHRIIDYNGIWLQYKVSYKVSKGITDNYC